MTPVAANNGWAKASKELVVNSTDAGAQRILMLFRRDGSVIFADDGKGMDARARDSVLSYGFSSKERLDLKTAGANGTGLKNCLGLGDINKTRIEIQTSTDGITFYRLDINFDYVVELAEKTANPSQYQKQIPKPKDWCSYLNRTSGTNIILHNCERIPNPSNVIKELAEYLVPPVARMVEVFDGVTLSGLNRVMYDGKPYSCEIPMGKFGTLTAELFIGVSKQSRIQVCGPSNAIMTLGRFWEGYGTKLPAELAPLSSCSGWIYLSAANQWRMHDGTFDLGFFKSNAASLFVEGMIQIADEVKVTLRQLNEDRNTAEWSEMLMEFVSANNLEFTNPVPGKATGVFRPAPSTHAKELEVVIVPNQFHLQPNQTASFTFTNEGTKKLDPERWVVDDAASLAKVKGTKLGNEMTLKSGSNLGTSYLTLTHPELHGSRSYQIKVVVGFRPDPFIEGPTKIQSGREIIYRLRYFDNDTKVVWSLKEKDSDVVIRGSGKRIANLLSKIANRMRRVTLVVHDQVHGRKIADKEIEVFPPVQNGSMSITVHKQRFELQPTTILIGGALAHIGHDWGDTPTIALNFNAPSLLLMPNKKQQLLNSVAMAAVSWLVQKDKLDPAHIPTVLEEFLERMNKRMKMS
ncbi:MAG: ATP-binding protein [Candidatus Absconditabacterales bacterium]